MNDNLNMSTYDFISEELTYHPELPQYSPEELAARKDDMDFWSNLEEQLDCFRICDVCGEPMLEGFLVCGSMHYCSEECLQRDWTEEEYLDLCEDEDNDTFWTTWFDNSKRN